MQEIHNKIALDVNSEKSSAVITAKSEDKGTRYIDAELTFGGEKITIGNNDRVVMTAAEADTGRTIGLIDGSVQNGNAVIELTDELLSAPGKLDCEIAVYGTDSKVLTSARFRLVITERIDSEVIEREADFSALTTALSDVAGTSNRIDALTERVQPVSLGGTGATDIITAAQNLKTASLKSGTAIAENDDLDDYKTSGTYYASRTAALTLTHSPVDGAFKLYVIEQQTNYYIQILVAVVGNTMWFRGSGTANTYSEWRKVLTADTVVEESGTWTPVPESGTISTVTANYFYDGKRITVLAKFTCGNDVATTLKLTGLPVATRNKSAGSIVVMDTASVVSVIASESKLQIKSAESLAGQTVIVTITYMV